MYFSVSKRASGVQSQEAAPRGGPPCSLPAPPEPAKMPTFQAGPRPVSESLHLQHCLPVGQGSLPQRLAPPPRHTTAQLAWKSEGFPVSHREQLVAEGRHKHEPWFSLHYI